MSGDGVNRASVAVVVPAYNEEDCVAELCSRLSAVFDAESAYDFTCFIVENGSEDATWELIRAAAFGDSRFVGVQLSRNFGMDGGLTAGMALVEQDACVLMTADLQDPPEVISDFLRQWELGYENVYGIVVSRQGTGFTRRLNSRIFYWLVSALTDNAIPRNASDFRLLDRRAYEAVRALPERNRFMRGLSAWVGFREVGIPIDRPERFAGESKASTSAVLKVATRGVLANSTLPLRLITLSGLALSTVSALAFLVLVAFWVLRGVPFAGFGSLLSLSLLAFGVLALMVGLVAEYVALIYEEVKGRPSYIVRETTRDLRN
jgi:dolichol-phosphate mannosyltransferase